MKRYIFTLFAAGIFLTLSVIALPWNMGAQNSEACGSGLANGQGYVPQRRDGTNNNYAARPALTEEQARRIIEQHVTKLNSTLKVGPMNDAGELFEAQVFSKDKEVVQIIGLEKFSGRLVLIN